MVSWTDLIFFFGMYINGSYADVTYTHGGPKLGNSLGKIFSFNITFLNVKNLCGLSLFYLQKKIFLIFYFTK